MKKDKNDPYAVSPLLAAGGRSTLSEEGIYYLKAAGIDPGMLSEMDRAAVIEALIFIGIGNPLFKNMHGGDALALFYKFGFLRRMLAWEEKQEAIKEEEDAKKKEEEKKKRERAELLFMEEARRIELMRAGEYAAQNPVPQAAVGMLLAAEVTSPLWQESFAQVQQEMLEQPSLIAPPAISAPEVSQAISIDALRDQLSAIVPNLTAIKLDDDGLPVHATQLPEHIVELQKKLELPNPELPTDVTR